MSELFEDTAPGNAPEFSVSELSGAIKRVIEGEFAYVRVRGEVGRVSRPSSGHVYFDLKDDRSVLAAVSWKGQAAKLAHRPEEGMEVIAIGRLTTFPGQSRYQLIVEDIQPAGAGALMAMLEARKKKLAAEGLFDEALKRPLPYLPEVIGVITSPSGAVIRDILHRLRDRFPRKVLIWPVAVQGQACAPEVTRAIQGFNALTPGGALPRPDLLIVARGGGSVEDLWGFNEESVARAAAASGIPLISAVGHETDTTLIDYVSDRRAPTPTAAAEMAVPVRMDLLAWTGEQGTRLTRALSDSVARRRQRLGDLSRALPRIETLLDTPRQRLDRADERLRAALVTRIQRERVRLGRAEGGLRPSVMRDRLARQAERLALQSARLGPGLGRGTQQHGRDLAKLAVRLDPARIEALRLRKNTEFQTVARRFSAVASTRITALRGQLEALDRTRQTLGYRETLKRGYAVVRGDGAVVTTAQAARAARRLEIEFDDGMVVPGGGGSDGSEGGPTEQSKSGARAQAKKPAPPTQGSLF